MKTNNKERNTGLAGVLALVALLFVLTGCEHTYAGEKLKEVEVGKVCFDAGGNWIKADNGSYMYCEFRQK